MATGLKIWIYRPDYEARERRMNKNFVYNARGERFFDVLDRENAQKQKYYDVKEKMQEEKKRLLSPKMEVPYE